MKDRHSKGYILQYDLVSEGYSIVYAVNKEEFTEILKNSYEHLRPACWCRHEWFYRPQKRYGPHVADVNHHTQGTAECSGT